ncbi:hypothetical protein [Streptomyces sp. MBT33]|uniref:hypothetical protein n=1 Tax=Streptomyces sp. MBT33 TaxID=1488363 RepID=UPI00190E4100|nr:hypothetical protein [Streptomyces sp. MBT33]MBK3643628.1 hypothetical protein [Streptomyces sp. MBT33]
MARPTNRLRLPIHAAVAVVAVLLTACSADPAPHSAGVAAADGPAQPVTRAHLSLTPPADPVRMALPATGAETRWTQGLDVFVQQVSRAATASCAAERGAAVPRQVPLAFIRFFEIPDLDFIARHGTSESAAVPTSAPHASATRPADPAVLRECGAEGKAAADALRDLYAPLQQRWFAELVSLRHDPATVKSLRALPPCLAGHGIRVRDENGFFALADARMQTAAAAELPRESRALGRAYAACMRPVEAVREPARERLRARFLKSHTREIRALRGTLVPALRHAETRYDVRLAFPAP